MQHFKNFLHTHRIIVISVSISLLILAGIIITAAVIHSSGGKATVQTIATRDDKKANFAIPLPVVQLHLPQTTPEELALVMQPSEEPAQTEETTDSPDASQTETSKNKPIEYKPVEVLPEVPVANTSDAHTKEMDPEYAKTQSSDKTITGITVGTSSFHQTNESYTENSNITYGIDVSHWQGKIDWTKVKNAGVEFAIIKVGGRSIGDSGSLYMDSCYNYNIQQALANGIKVGVYFFSQAITEHEAIEEASVVLENIKGYKITYPIVFDWEDGKNYRGNKANLSKTQYINITKAFCETIKNAGYEPMMYGNAYSSMAKYAAPALSGDYKFWLASYTNDLNKAPKYSGIYQMWQYTSSGTVDGISGRVDLNVAYFGYTGKQDALKLNVSNTSIVLNPGQTVNLMDGVSAVNSIGKDITSSVTYTIKNAAGNQVSENDALQTPGTYAVTYSVTDFTGGKKETEASLVIRSNPEIRMNSVVVTLPDTLSEEAMKQKLLENATAYDYAGNDISSSLQVEGYEGAVAGQGYSIAYHVTDANGLSSTVYGTLLVVNGSPSITYTISERTITASALQPLNLLSYVHATDYKGTTLEKDYIKVYLFDSSNQSVLVTQPENYAISTPGTYRLQYEVTDSENNSVKTDMSDAITVQINQ